MKNVIAQAYAMGQAWMELALKDDYAGASAVSVRLDALQDKVASAGTIVGWERGYSDWYPQVEWDCYTFQWPAGTKLYAVEDDETP